jgi:hypothetical protein
MTSNPELNLPLESVRLASRRTPSQRRLTPNSLAGRGSRVPGPSTPPQLRRCFRSIKKASASQQQSSDSGEREAGSYSALDPERPGLADAPRMEATQVLADAPSMDAEGPSLTLQGLRVEPAESAVIQKGFCRVGTNGSSRRRKQKRDRYATARRIWSRRSSVAEREAGA